MARHNPAGKSGEHKGMGFEAAEESAEAHGARNPGAVIAAGARKASDKATRANPNLMKVSGVKPPKKG